MTAVLTVLIFSPLVGAIIVALLPKRRPELNFPVAVGVSIVPLAISLWVLASFDIDGPIFQFTEDISFSEALGIGWRVGVDGISLWMVMLTVVLFPLAIAASKVPLNRWIKSMVQQIMPLSLAMEDACFSSEDAAEAGRAFMEKREPVFQGR